MMVNPQFSWSQFRCQATPPCAVSGLRTMSTWRLRPYAAAGTRSHWKCGVKGGIKAAKFGRSCEDILFTSIYMKCITNWYLGFTANHYTKYSEVELWGFQHRRDPKNGYIHSGLTTGNGMVWYHNIGMAIPKYGNHNSGLTTYYCMVW